MKKVKKMNNNNFEKQKEYHKQVAEEIIAMLEKGTAPWQKPWDAATYKIPHNGVTNRRYQGMNALRLMYLAHERGYEDNRWMTFNQIKEQGGAVKKGEKGTIITYWKFMEKNELDENIEEVESKLPVRPIPFRFVVFNAEQCNGLPKVVLPELKWDPIERADNIIKNYGVEILHDQVDSNFYRPLEDKIHLTPKECFKSPEDYYAVLLHEMSHSTGHSSRLNRDILNTFASEGYAREELRAEIASFMLCTELGISNSVADERHAAYVGGWIKVLREDPTEIFRAARDADVMYKYILEKGLDKEIQEENALANKANEVKELATENQLKVLKEAGQEVVGNITKTDADKLISKLPATKVQIEQMEKHKIQFEKNITRGEASKLISDKFKEFEKIANEPISENQIAYLEKHKIKLDISNMKRGEVSKIIYEHQQEIKKAMEAPITDKQFSYLQKANINVNKEMTAGEASKIIHEYQKNRITVSDKQMRYCKDNNIMIPEKSTKMDVIKIIGSHKRLESIRNFTPSDKITISREYKNEAQKKLLSNKEIDDKKIAAVLLKKGYEKKSVINTLYNYSPNCTNDAKKALEIVNSALKLPSVQKFKAKENQLSR